MVTVWLNESLVTVHASIEPWFRKYGGTTENWKEFREICHNYIIAWCDHYSDFIAFPREIIIIIIWAKEFYPGLVRD